jgi:hypothetical protein
MVYRRDFIYLDSQAVPEAALRSRMTSRRSGPESRVRHGDRHPGDGAGCCGVSRWSIPGPGMMGHGMTGWRMMGHGRSMMARIPAP